MISLDKPRDTENQEMQSIETQKLTLGREKADETAVGKFQKEAKSTHPRKRL